MTAATATLATVALSSPTARAEPPPGAVALAPARPATDPGTAGPRPRSSAASYPFASDNASAIDPWGAQKRQCTSFASWWLASHGVTISPEGLLTGPRTAAVLGDARHWDVAARRAGYAQSALPEVGAIAQWHADERSTWRVPDGRSYLQAGASGHVAVVRAVFPDGTALLQDYNGVHPLGFSSFRGRAPRYLLITG